MKNHGIIFDMDNTILDTHIDFNLMHKKTAAAAAAICKNKLHITPPDFSEMATGQIIDWGAEKGFSQQDLTELWAEVAEIEAQGMAQIDKENGVDAMLADLKKTGYYLTMLTNNSLRAAKIAMQNSGLNKYFDEIHARDEYQEVKPSPKGILSIMAANRNIKKWLMIGDSWLDGEAATKAGIAFAAYGSNDKTYWQNYEINPKLCLPQWDEKTVLAINNFMNKACLR